MSHLAKKSAFRLLFLAILMLFFAFIAYLPHPFVQNVQATTERYVLVTDLAQLSDGDTVLIVAKDFPYALGRKGSNYFFTASTTKEGNFIDCNGETKLVIRKNADGSFSFSTNDGYLCASKTFKAQLLLTDTVTAYASFDATINSDGTATFRAQAGSYRILQFNDEYKCFSCYNKNIDAICLYKYYETRHDVTYSVLGKTTQEQLSHGETPNFPDVPETVGAYRFLGWSTSPQIEEEDTPTLILSNQEIENDVNFYAVYATDDDYATRLPTFTDVRLSLATGIQICYIADVPTDFQGVTLRFELNGQPHEIVGEPTNEGTLFRVPLAPQYMTERLQATLVRANGDIVASHDGFCVRTYVDEQLPLANEEERELYFALLRYGAAAQKYVGYKTDALATDGLDLAPLSTPTGKIETPQSVSDNLFARFSSAQVWFAETNRIRVSFALASSTDLNKVTITINGNSVPISGNAVLTEDIAPTAFDETFLFELYYDGVKMQTLSFSVNAYAVRCGDIELTAALYAYGQAAEKVGVLN